MKKDIETKLALLVGQPLWAIGRAANVVWLQFGKRHTVVDRWRGAKVVGSYALHLVECPWSWVRSWGEIIADDDADADELADLLPTPVICEGVEGGADGSFRMTFHDNSTLEVEAADLDSDAEEYWRFFEPHLRTAHFVVGPKGIGS